MILDSGEHFAWLALRRIHSGLIARSGAYYLDGGRPVGTLTAAAFDVLIERGLVAVAEPSPQDCLSRLSLTDAGQARYAALCREAALPPPPPEFGSVYTVPTDGPKYRIGRERDDQQKRWPVGCPPKTTNSPDHCS